VIDGGDPCASPTAFSSSVHNAAAANLSIIAGITGPCLTVSNFELSLHAALLSAARWLSQGRVETVLLGAVDEFGPVVGYCRDRFHGLPDPSSFDPLDYSRQNAIPGEGAVFLVLKKGTGNGGRGTGYGTIGQLACGSGSPPEPEESALLVVGADGMAVCSRGYAAAVGPGEAPVSWARLYGSFPTAPAMDLAAALVCAKDGIAYPTPGAGIATPLAGRAIYCLKLAADGWGTIVVDPERP
jgi:3-oxoacyl-[acyl-carrier-protein] synthase II